MSLTSLFSLYLILQKQWRNPKGAYACGVCGDSFDFPQPRPHERGGIYGKGPRVRMYTAEQVVEVMIQTTANHKGLFEFRLCPTHDPDKRATQECFDRHLLRMADTNSTGFAVDSDVDALYSPRGKDVYVRVRLPADLACSWCVLQWRWRAGKCL